MNNKVYPKQREYNQGCQVNLWYKTMPSDIQWKSQTDGPESCAKAYVSPNYYPTRCRSVPIGTLYEKDLTVYGFGGKIESYGYKLYPFSHRYIREVNKYSNEILPYADYSTDSKPVSYKKYWGGWEEPSHW